MKEQPAQEALLDVLVLALPPGTFTCSARMAGELAVLLDTGLLRLIDAVAVKRSLGGGLITNGFEPIHGIGATLTHQGEPPLLRDDDVADLAADVPPGRSAAIVVLENAWMEPLIRAIHHSGGRLAARGRSPQEEPA